MFESERRGKREGGLSVKAGEGRERIVVVSGGGGLEGK